MQSQTAASHGFVAIGNHHEGPHDQSYEEGTSSMLWWEADPSEFTYVTTVRNHFDVILTWYTITAGNPPKPHQIGRRWARGTQVPVEFLEVFWLGHPKFFKHKHQMWRYAWELPQDKLRVMKFENIRTDFDLMLRDLTGRGLEPWEFQHLPGHKTAGRPDSYATEFSAESRAWVERVYREEMERFQYSWEGGLQ